MLSLYKMCIRDRYGTVEVSESIKFVFYTNTNIKKEKKVGELKKIKETLPEEPLIQLLCEKKYDEAFPFVLPVFRAYYLEQHKKHINKEEDIELFEKILDSMDKEKWEKFFDLIEWNFGKADEIEIRKNVERLVGEICLKYNAVSYTHLSCQQQKLLQRKCCQS